MLCGCALFGILQDFSVNIEENPEEKSLSYIGPSA